MLHEGLGCVAMWRHFPERVAAVTGCRVLVWSRAGYGQQAAAGEAGQGARQAQLVDDVGARGVPPEQGGENVGRRDRYAAGRQRRPKTRQCQQHEDGENQEGAAVVGHQRKL